MDSDQHITSLDRCTAESSGTLYDVVAKLNLRQIRFIVRQLLEIISKNHHKPLAFAGLTPKMINLTFKNEYYYPSIDLNSKEKVDFSPPKTISAEQADIYCLGLLLFYMLRREQMYFPVDELASSYFEFVKAKYGDPNSEDGPYLSHIDVNKLREAYELICFIEGCTGYLGKKLNRIYSLEQLQNHVYVKETPIPIHLLAQIKNSIDSEKYSKDGLSKFIYKQGGQSYILFCCRPKRNDYNKEWVSFYLKKVPSDKITLNVDELDRQTRQTIKEECYKLNFSEIEVNKKLNAAGVPNVLTSFASKLPTKDSEEITKFKLYIKYQEGLNLDDYAKRCCDAKLRSFIPEKDIQTIFRDITMALKGIHTERIIFRDLNPANVMVYINDKDELHAKIIDFGVSSLQKYANTDVGDSNYKAPEMVACMGNSSYSKSVDIYSFGRTLYYTITARTPNDLLEINGEDGLSLDIIDILEGCIQIDSKMRFSSFDEILAHPFFLSKFTNRMVCKSIIICAKCRSFHEKYRTMQDIKKMNSE